jgi:hypothetical protein
MWMPIETDTEELASHRGAVNEWAENTGHLDPDKAWLLHDFDVWVANPHYTGPKVPHPEEEEPMEDGLFTDANQAWRFIKAGKAKVTIVSKKTGTRFTFKVKAPEEGAIRFVSVLNGPDNWENYQYIGFIAADGQFVAGRKGHPDAPSFKAFHWVWHKLEAGRLPDSVEVWHEGRCGRCGRLLTVPESIASGFGPECAAALGL